MCKWGEEEGEGMEEEIGVRNTQTCVLFLEVFEKMMGRADMSRI